MSAALIPREAVVRRRAAPSRPAPVPGPEALSWSAARCLLVATAVPALVGVPLGAALGYWAGTGQLAHVPYTGLVQAHGQLQLFGWLGLAVLGVTFQAMATLFRVELDAPAARAAARLATAVLGLELLGVALRLMAPLAPGAPGALVLLASALALAGAFALTLEAHVRTLTRRPRDGRAPGILPRFLFVGLVLWFLALLANLDGAIEALRHGPAGAGAMDGAHDAFVVAAMTGGLAMIALGMSLRVVTGWLDLPAPDLRRAGRAWWPLAAAVILRALASSLPAGTATAALVAGAALWAAGVWTYLPVLRGLWSASTVTAGGGARGEADPPLAWFVRTAYAWLALSSLLALGEAGLTLAGSASAAWMADAGRHAVLFGFLGLLTAGLSGRLPAAFLDIDSVALSATRGRYRIAWGLLLGASVARVAAALAGPWATWRMAGLVLAGTLGSLGLLALLAVLVHTMWLAQRTAGTPDAPASASS